MKIVSGFRHPDTHEWNGMIENMQNSAMSHGHNVVLFDLPTKDKWLVDNCELLLSVCWKYKVIFLREVLDIIDDDILWIDGDCVVMKEIPFDEATKDCDIAFTLRDIRDRKKTACPVQDGYINSGVILLKNTDGARSFLKAARDELVCSLYDQEAFNKVILRKSLMQRHGEIVNVAGCAVKLLDCRVFNNFYFDDSAKSARILHFKGIGRDIYKRFAEDGFKWK